MIWRAASGVLCQSGAVEQLILKAGTLTRISGKGSARCKLQLLDFPNNPLLASLPLKGLAGIQSLLELACAKCPNLWSPPQEIAAQGGKDCMDFARAALADGEVDTRMTLFLLGDGEAGKTSVFRALRSINDTAQRIQEDKRTIDIDTEEWQPVAAGLGKSLPLQFRVFDLAGQAVYEMTHHFFLLQRAVYMLVWRAFPPADERRSVLTDWVLHWMRSLQLRVPGACVILVVTHIDAVDAAALDNLCGAVRATVQQCLVNMHSKAPLEGRVLSVLDGGESQRVNCLLGEGVAVLRQRLLNYAFKMP
jgi:internalin A